MTEHRPCRRQYSVLCCILLVLLSMVPARADEWADQLRVPAVQQTMLSLARRAMTQYLQHGTMLRAPAHLPPILRRRAAVFVTVENRWKIAPRGCRGTLQPSTPTLADEIIRNSIAACSRDRRVAPLRLAELPQCLISLTVVLRVQPLSSIAGHDPDNNGLIAQSGSRIGIVLPYEGRDAAVQLKWAKRKAGLADDAPAQLSELIAVRFREKVLKK
ncbi:MAG TPA: AMMECR1 domain-containing protein [Abditibacteriaceae bacterium]|nr:AMMECR1 domain-containing protein [Abditibacteriaceae bacterium]